MVLQVQQDHDLCTYRSLPGRVGPCHDLLCPVGPWSGTVYGMVFLAPQCHDLNSYIMVNLAPWPTPVCQGSPGKRVPCSTLMTIVMTIGPWRIPVCHGSFTTVGSWHIPVCFWSSWLNTTMTYTCIPWFPCHRRTMTYSRMSWSSRRSRTWNPKPWVWRWA